MEKQTITIPDGCKAEIRQENGKTVIVIEGKKGWRAKYKEKYFFARVSYEIGGYIVWNTDEEGYDIDCNRYDCGNYFRTREEAETFCDDLNKAVKPILDKAKRGEYDK